MKRLFALIICFAAPAWAAMALNPAVTQATIGSTNCIAGYTKTVRPPVAYTNKVKRQLMAKAGLLWSRASELELDHRIALTIGGAPRSLDNLWLQSWEPAMAGWKGANSAKVKDKLEVRLNKLVCKGKLKLAEAQSCIYNDWQACAKKHP